MSTHSEAAGGHSPGAGGHQHGGRTGLLALGALGIVFGDIGTNPLFAMREAFEGGHHLAITEANVLGLLSLMFWSLILVITVKYLTFVMRADNDGEGGILALAALITSGEAPVRGKKWILLLIGMFGAALLYGDGIITPAISVLAAVEGTVLVAPSFEPMVIPAAIVILILLFLVQPKGTTSIGRVFGPVMVTWFVTLAVLGLYRLAQRPSVLQAVNPVHGVQFFANNGFTGFLVLGAVILVVVGGEALFADMGHFGRRPILIGWYGLVLPSLILVYFGQGALLIGDPAAIDNPFYRMAPSWALIPLVVLATMATVIASQALISGAFSITSQAVQLGLSPRVRVKHTSETEYGQIYIAAINWFLLLACIGLVLWFRSSSNLAAAYGLAVTTTMVITTVLFYFVAREYFGWTTLRAAPLCAVFLAVDLAFFGSTMFKIPDGGWFPLVMAAVVFTLLSTWRTGRRLVRERLIRRHLPMAQFVESLSHDTAVRTGGDGAYFFSTPGATPPALLANLRHNGTLHETVLIVSVLTTIHPRVLGARRATVHDLGDGFYDVQLHYGFMETPDIPTALADHVVMKTGVDLDTISYFLGRESLRVTERPGMARWREHLFALMSRNATSAASYFGLPLDQTVEIGIAIEL